jgi:AraC-like DNA-binding protein
MASPASRSGADGAVPPLCILALLKRDRARALVRAAFPRRRAHVYAVKTLADLEGAMCRQLVDVVVVDGGAGEDAYRTLGKAEAYGSVPFVLITAMLPADAPMVARAAECGVAEILVEGVDDGVARELVLRRAFTSRFERALALPPPNLGLESALQIAVWQSVVKRAGRPVRTEQLARELDVSREHLSRSFATGRAPTLKRVIDLVRVLAAAELAKNAGYDIRDVAEVLGFASSSHLSSTTQRLVGAKASSLTRLRAIDLLERFERHRDQAADDEDA